MSCYDSARWLRDAVDSVLAQTDEDFELIIRDDGSRDETRRMAEEYAARDPRVRVLSGPNVGYAASLQILAAAAQGELIGTIDPDDKLAAEAVARCRRALADDSSAGFVYTDYWVIDGEGAVIGPGTRTRVPYSPLQILVHFMTFHFRLVRRGVYDRVGGYDPATAGVEDYDLCMRMSEVAGVAHVPERLYYYRKHPTSYTAVHRVEQIELTRKAIQRALERRGLTEEYQLDVEIVGQFMLRRREPA
jgi:glycosyltransferase involved in cell wall biosynthesis